MSAECRGALLLLGRSGIIGPYARELIIDRLMNLNVIEVSLFHLTTILFMVLVHQPKKLIGLLLLQQLMVEREASQLH